MVPQGMTRSSTDTTVAFPNCHAKQIKIEIDKKKRSDTQCSSRRSYSACRQGQCQSADHWIGPDCKDRKDNGSLVLVLR